ncbi:MAG TPA: xylose isomerase [Planctomycetaceae bacterium]|nr:xylose isomerase [Planctomycetaceae bacterium]
MSDLSNRRGFLQSGSALAGAAVALAARPTSAQPTPTRPSFRFCLNTSTIREQKVGIVREIEIAREAGYDAIEPWMDALHQYVADGGSLSDLKKRLQDAGLVVPSAIGFAHWIVDDAEARKQGLENARRDMDLLAQIGGQRIAAPPVGAQDKPGPDLATISQRYRALLELGDQLGVIPQCEVWGFSKTLSKLSETAYAVIGANHPRACLLADVYHLHKGGSGFDGVQLLSGLAMQVFHMNDYPAQPGPEQINDSHRVYPGDGVAPLVPLLRTLKRVGFDGVLSLELFNREYWKQDPLQVAKTGLQKMKAVAQQAESA